jgi:hypothetical protein
MSIDLVARALAAKTSTVPGPAGKNAYQLAVEQGFAGTQAEWLASLVGQPGEGADPATIAAMQLALEAALDRIAVLESPDTLAPLVLTPDEVRDDAEPGDLIGLVEGVHPFEEIVTLDDAGGRLVYLAGEVRVGDTPLSLDPASTRDLVLHRRLAKPGKAVIEIEAALTVNVISAMVLDALPLEDMSVAADLAAGAEIADLGPLLPGETRTITPNDGRVVFNEGQTHLLRGLTAWSPGDIAYTVFREHPDAVNSPLGTSWTLTVEEAGAPTFDHLIASDADWASVMALGAAALSGKRIGVQPGTYSKKALTLNGHAQPIIFEATDPLNKPVINRLVLGTSGAGAQLAEKLTFRGLEVVTTSWQLNPEPCVAYTNWDNIVFEQGCEFRSGYRGNPAVPFDPTKNDYPELAAIYPQFDNAGAVSSLVINNYPNCYVGDLKADGTYPLVFSNAPGQITFSTLPTGTFTVSGGYITATSLTSGGASDQTSVVNTSLGILSKVVSWAGQQPLLLYFAFGHQAVNAATAGSFTIRDCRLDNLNNAIKLAPTKAGSSVMVIGNSFDTIYQDFTSFGLAARASGLTPYAPPPLTLKWNVGTRSFWRSGDPKDPHGDWVQTYMSDEGAADTWTTADWLLDVEGNVYFDGACRGGVQGYFFSEVPANGIAYTGRVVGNVVLSKGLTNGVTIDALRDCYVARNLIARYDTSHPLNLTAVNLRMGVRPSIGQNVLLDNILEGMVIDSVPNVAAVAQVGNVLLGNKGASIPYGSVFEAPASAPTTLAALAAAFQSKAAYAGKGAFNSDGYIDHVARTLNRDLERPYVRLDSLLDQAVASPVNSGWVRVLGGPTGGVAITDVVGGAYQIADDAAGANATASTSANGLIAPGKYLRVGHTSAAGHAASVTTTLKLGGWDYSFTSSTSSAAQFLAVDNQGTAYSKIAAPPNEAGLKKALIAVRVRPDVLAVNANVFADNSAGTRLYTPTTALWRFLFITSATVQHRTTTTIPQAGVWQTHLMAVDLTKTNAAEVSRWYIDGVNQAQAANSVIDVTGTATFTTNQLFGSATGFGLFGEGDGGGVLLDGAMEFFLMRYGDGDYVLPDISDPAVRNLFTADLIGEIGPSSQLFYTGDAAGWNAGLANGGTLAARPLTKMAGDYVAAT